MPALYLATIASLVRYNPMVVRFMPRSTHSVSMSSRLRRGPWAQNTVSFR